MIVFSTNGNTRYRVGHGKHVRRTTTWIVRVGTGINGTGWVHEYIVPHATSESNAIQQVRLNLSALIDFYRREMGDAGQEAATWVTEKDAFTPGHREKVSTLREYISGVQKSVDAERGKAEQLALELASHHTESGAHKRLSTELMLCWEKIEALNDNIKEAREKLQRELHEPERVEQASPFELATKKLREAINCIDRKQATAKRLFSWRVYPVSYFDDSRGRVSHVPNAPHDPEAVHSLNCREVTE